MKHRILLPITAAIGVALSVGAVAQGRLSNLEQGQYVCAVPGDATGAPWIEVPEMSFTIAGASSYSARAGGGTYLLSGDKVEFTRGPLKGQKFVRNRMGLLQRVNDAGTLGRIRCHRTGPVPE